MATKEEWTGIAYKVMPNVKYRVWRKEWNNVVYYSIQVSQKNYDDTVSKWYKPVNFKKGEDIPNETDIIIKKAVENLRENKKDPYNPISSLMILDYEIVENEKALQNQAYSDFRDNLDENENGTDDFNYDEYELPF